MPNSRDLWTPKRPEVAQQCASCPFRLDNHKEVVPIILRLRKMAGDNRQKVTPKDIMHFRMTVRMDQSEFGDFSCHGTVYNQDMTQKPQHEWRQCKGATEHYKSCGKPI